MKFNDPFYFAVPRNAPMSAVSDAQMHIEKTFGITGKPEVLRSELAFTLCRLVDTTEQAS